MSTFESPFISFFISTYAHNPDDETTSFPSLPFHKVIAIAFLQVDNLGAVKMGSSPRKKEESRAEVELLLSFLNSAAQSLYPFATFQAQKFVLPVFLHRAVKYGISIPKQLQDVEDIAPNNSFNDVFHSIGLPSRPPLNVKKAYEEGNIIHVRRRLEIDVLGLALVRMRWEVAKGKLSAKSYRAVISTLLERCRGRSKKMREFVEAMDMEKILLEGYYNDAEEVSHSSRDS